jgi:hypothetical protein
VCLYQRRSPVSLLSRYRVREADLTSLPEYASIVHEAATS